MTEHCDHTLSDKIEAPVMSAEEDIAMQIREQVKVLQGSISKAARMNIKCEIEVRECNTQWANFQVPAINLSISKVL